jgi:hypothetical protein
MAWGMEGQHLRRAAVVEFNELLRAQRSKKPREAALRVHHWSGSAHLVRRLTSTLLLVHQSVRVDGQPWHEVVTAPLPTACTSNATPIRAKANSTPPTDAGAAIKPC